jgi:hypothetical protein
MEKEKFYDKKSVKYRNAGIVFILLNLSASICCIYRGTYNGLELSGDGIAQFIGAHLFTIFGIIFLINYYKKEK